MTMRTLSPNAAKRLTLLASGEVELPVKIKDQRERMAAAAHAAENSISGKIDLEELENVVRMKRTLDMLYVDWAEGIERVRWCDLPAMPNLTPEVILRECVYSTEAVRGAMGVEVLAAYLEAMGHNGLVEALAKQCLGGARSLLEEALSFEEETSNVFHDPKTFFGVSEEDAARVCVGEYLLSRMPVEYPPHVMNALVAHIEFGLSNFLASIRYAGYAQNARDMPRFGAPDVPRAAMDQTLLKVERHKAGILIGLFNKSRA